MVWELKEDEISVCIMILYQLWLARNDSRDEEQVATPNEIIQKSVYLLKEWQGLRPACSAVSA
jgi:hypothetical protein